MPSLIDKLKQQQYNTIVRSREYKELLKEMSKRIVKQSTSAPNEATIENYFDCELFAFFREVFSPLGFEYCPKKEASIATKRHITKGRADTLLGALVIEFKQPSTLSNKVLQDNAVNQVIEYLDGLEIESELVGFVTDGTKGCFVIRSEAGYKKELFSILNSEQLDRLIQLIIQLKLTALTSVNLVNDFCNPPANNGVAFKLFKNLYDTLRNNITPKTQMLFDEWKELFNLSHDDVSQQQAIIDRKRSLELLLNEAFSDNDEEYTALFALQTAYVIIIKIIAYRIISIVRYNSSFIDFENLASTNEDALRQQLVSLEDGAIFRGYGITNLLEGDFFSWYSTSEQWNSCIANSISEIFVILCRYADKSVLNSDQKSADFFKDLYQHMMPSAVRHSLGEYYTKQWIAKEVFDEAVLMNNKSSWRGLDPCCGSGTFITVMIDKVLEETIDKDDTTRLKEVLSRVSGIDLNPVAVLTARVNYFINVAHLMTSQDELEIPVYLGDSSYVPKACIFDNKDCLEYTINTLVKPINIIVPRSMVRDTVEFSKVMTGIELNIRALDEQTTYNKLESLIDPDDLTENIKNQVHSLSRTLVDLESRNWDGIWARIITNYLTTANLGKFDIIVGNPPWVDWKSLPSGYRDRIKGLCISRQLFSGDRITGGINLNICALISNVVAENWLSEDGTLGFLMPEPLLFQQSYEGFRNLYLSDGTRLYFKKLTNWTKAGNPFKPVTQKFLTYYMTKTAYNYKEGIDVDWMILKDNKKHDDLEVLDINEYFDVISGIAATCHKTKNMFSYIESRQQLSDFMSIAGESYYLGREGIEFYPQEMTIFELSGLPNTRNCTSLKNIQVKKSKYKVPQSVELLETDYLHPLVKGVDITPFHVNISGLIVPFPYDKRNTRLPIALEELARIAPNLAAFYQRFKDLILAQTSYNERIIGKSGEFYALARVGAYSFAKHYVVFRDNTKWGAAVISDIDTDWGGLRHPLFQNHCVSICEDVEGNYISEDEAHFICGIINAPIVYEYVLKSSDSRSFPIRPRIYIPKYDSYNWSHRRIVELSKTAHNNYNDSAKMEEISRELNTEYLQIARGADRYRR
jgi:hypothetical protein